MLDRDLAELYGVQAIRLREQVKRNLDRFLLILCFGLQQKKLRQWYRKMRYHQKHLGGSLRNAFTEHGVLMLANVLKSDQALNVSIRVIEIFVKMREMLSTNKDILLQMQKIEKKLTAHT